MGGGTPVQGEDVEGGTAPCREATVSQPRPAPAKGAREEDGAATGRTGAVLGTSGGITYGLATTRGRRYASSASG